VLLDEWRAIQIILKIDIFKKNKKNTNKNTSLPFVYTSLCLIHSYMQRPLAAYVCHSI